MSANALPENIGVHLETSNALVSLRAVANLAGLIAFMDNHTVEAEVASLRVDVFVLVILAGFKDVLRKILPA